ncbi:MAG: hypothetical protein ACFFAS_15080 [Promethearchaeota archaeon]
MKNIEKVLFICTGNTARSPAAEYLAKYHAKHYGNKSLIFDSAGFINAFTYMQPESRKYLNLKGIDHSNFTPKIVNRTLIAENDLIITMETQHVNDLLEEFNDIENIKEKTMTLKAFNGRKGDIIDPYYTNKNSYMKVMEELERNVEELVMKLVDTDENPHV